MNSLTSLWTLIATASLRAGVLIAIVLALRWALRGRVPAQCFHWLWILVAIRLLLPVAPGSASPPSSVILPSRAPLTACACAADQEPNSSTSVHAATSARRLPRAGLNRSSISVPPLRDEPN